MCADMHDFFGSLNDPKQVVHREPAQCQNAVMRKHGKKYLTSKNREVGDTVNCPICGRCWKVSVKKVYPRKGTHDIAWERYKEGDKK